MVRCFANQGTLLYNEVWGVDDKDEDNNDDNGDGNNNYKDNNNKIREELFPEKTKVGIVVS